MNSTRPRLRAVIGAAILSTLPLACAAPAAAPATATTITGTAMSDSKKQVVELLKSIETGASEPAAVVNPAQYKQHNLAVGE
jgi:hypothetical protein